MFQLILAALLISYASADLVKFTDCGKAEAKSVDVSGCAGDACTLKQGQSVVVAQTFVANQDSAKATFKMTATISGVELTLPNVETDGCKKITCPIKKGETYVLKDTLKIDTLPAISNIVVTGTLTGDTGVLSCSKVTVSITAA